MFFRRKILCKEKLICMVQVVYVSINPWVIRHSAHLAMLSSKQDELRTEMRKILPAQQAKKWVLLT